MVVLISGLLTSCGFAFFASAFRNSSALNAAFLASSCARLIAAGMDSATPAAVVERGTTLAQRVVTATVATLPEAVTAADCQPPLLIIVGAVVGLRERLKWFEQTVSLKSSDRT